MIKSPKLTLLFYGIARLNPDPSATHVVVLRNFLEYMSKDRKNLESEQQSFNHALSYERRPIDPMPALAISSTFLDIAGTI